MFNRNRKPWRLARTLILSIAILGYVFAAKGALCASLLWDEAVDGSLSANLGAPTDLGTLGNGEYDIQFSSTPAGIPKYFTINMDPGTNMSAVILVDWKGTGEEGFFGVTKTSNGATWTGTFTSADEYEDILPVGTLLGNGEDYRFVTANWTSGGPTWRMRFRIVPEPSTAVMLGLGLGGLVWSSRRK